MTSKVFRVAELKDGNKICDFGVVEFKYAI